MGQTTPTPCVAGGDGQLAFVAGPAWRLHFLGTINHSATPPDSENRLATATWDRVARRFAYLPNWASTSTADTSARPAPTANPSTSHARLTSCLPVVSPIAASRDIRSVRD